MLNLPDEPELSVLIIFLIIGALIIRAWIQAVIHHYRSKNND